MLLALELFRIGQLAAGRQNAVLRLQRGSVRTDRLGSGRRARTCGHGARDTLCGLGDLRAGDEAFKIAFLLGVEVASHCLARRLENAAGFAAHSAGTCVGMVRGTATVAGLCVM